MSEFDWDEANLRHIARHNVTPQEIEKVFHRPYALEVREPKHCEEQLRAHGTTARGRYLTVVFTERKSRARAITAWNMTREDKEEYADEIHK